MKKSLIVIIMTVTMLLVTACGKDNTPKNALGDESYRIIKLVEMHGEVNYTRDSKEQAAYLNMNFEDGDKVATGVESSASINLDDNKRLIMGADTSIAMTAEGDKENSRTIITLEQGEIMNSINEKLAPNAMYEIETSNATIGVRGTVFYVKADGDMTIVYCDEGVVAIETGDVEESISAGQAAKIEDEAVELVEPEEIKNEIPPEMLEEAYALKESIETGTDDASNGTSGEDAVGDKLPNGAVLEADGYYWTRYDDGTWIKYDAEGRYVEERGNAVGANGESRYRISKYVTDEHGFNYMYQMDVYDSATDALVEAYIYHYDFVEERPVDENTETVTKKLWYTYYYEETVKGLFIVQEEKTVYISGTNSWDEDGWN